MKVANPNGNTVNFKWNDIGSKLYDYKNRSLVHDRILRQRLDTVLPSLMKSNDIDCWIVTCREYNEDPIFKTLVPYSMFTTRRTAIFVFYLQDDGLVKRYAITRAHIGLDDLYVTCWENPKGSSWCKNPSKAETQWECLNRVLMNLKPNKIALNMSKEFAFADGLSTTFYNNIIEVLDDSLKPCICSSESLCIGWLETRSKDEMMMYDGIVQVANALIDSAFSASVILPGVTTNDDVKYYMMDQAFKYNLEPWFDYEVSIIREGVGHIEECTTILPGDILHCDIGIRYLGLCTDTQELAYILKPGESDAPEDIKELMKKVNRLQDIVVDTLEYGKTGNQILALARAKAIDEGLQPCIYTHPLGIHGHAAGMNIGLCDQQHGINDGGDYPMHDHTAYSLELNCSFENTRYGDISLGMETDILAKDGIIYYLGRRQMKYHCV